MKSRSYFVLFPLYAVVTAFVLYVNGVFEGETVSISNLLINGVFLIIIGILFLVSSTAFGRLNRCTDALVAAAEQMQKEYREAGGRNIWARYQERKDMFPDAALNGAFQKYRTRMRGYRARHGYSGSCDIGEYINEDLLDSVGMTYFNSGIAGTLTGLGILGTFLGLALGLGSFRGDDIYTISDNVGPLLAGMKVAFHTSVYGIFFSLIFNFVYRGVMADAYGKLEDFLDVFRQCAQPVVASEDENIAAMLVYQANISNSLKQVVELMNGTGKAQTEGLERIVDQFVERMNAALGTNMQQLGASLKETGESQRAYASQCEKLTEAAAGLVEMNRAIQKNMEQLARQQEAFAGELARQRERLESACDEIGSQLYTFEQMRSYYEE